ncbi:phenylacetate--CoA ligase PaaK [Actinopolyspora mortivallis]|uniref:Phenylacetate-coenzyme A ligase n=1 Tax=Actinopolyspora mortivallis TaxID=33906 RepID=A0A2T0GT91_ACTMO|nr:phenylacetate--CoA ligase PaaK [Actinopolyspora mortivallis]PRW62253.1 phenylacetate--CoA ligase [Actinopolyspora mortivallis]
MTETLPEHTSSPSRSGRPDPAELMDPAELAELQLSRLRATLRHAYENVPCYRRKFDEAGVHPEDCRSLSDLAAFPTTTKEDLREHYPDGMFAVPPERLRRIHASSGTTGTPTVVGYTAEDLDAWSEVVARSLRVAGAHPGQKVHVSYGYGLFTGGLGAHYGAERLGCAVIPASGGMTERQVRLIRDLEPEVIMITPSYMLTLLDEFRRQGLDPRRSSLKVGIFGAEPWTAEMRAEIEESAGIDAVDIYGLSEVMGPGVASECVSTKDGPHVWEDHFYPEIVDPGTGEPLPDGSRGELVFTSLTKTAMPIVRYRTRDLTRLLPGTAVPGMRRMERVTGRSDDMIVLRGVNVFPSQIEELVLRQPELSPHFRIELTRSGRLDELCVRVEAAEPASARDRGVPERLVTAIRDSVGVGVTVEVVAPHTLDRSTGKSQRVVDLR